jgi:hypothetical protein
MCPGNLFGLLIQEKKPESEPDPATMPPAHLGISALRILPVPMIVLDRRYRIVMANPVMKKLFFRPDGPSLYQKTLSQAGVEMLEQGHVVKDAWEYFFSSLKDDLRSENCLCYPHPRILHDDQLTCGTLSLACVNAVAGYGIASGNREDSYFVVPVEINKGSQNQSCYSVRTKMTVTFWKRESKQTYCLLTFGFAELLHGHPDDDGHM